MQKENIQKLVSEARSEFSRSLFEMKEAGRNIREAGAAAARDPLGVVSDVISNRLSSAQRWKLVGVALLAGGVAGYSSGARSTFSPRHSGLGASSTDYSSTVLAPRAAGWLRGVVYSIKDELAAEARVFGHRTLQRILRAAYEGADRN
jgi:hypothetical protein